MSEVNIAILHELNKTCREIWEKLTNPTEEERQKYDALVREQGIQYVLDLLRPSKQRLTSNIGERFLYIFREAFREYVNNGNLTGLNVEYRSFCSMDERSQRLLIPYYIKSSFYEDIGWSKLSRLSYRRQKKLLKKLVNRNVTFTWREPYGKPLNEFFKAWGEQIVDLAFNGEDVNE